MKDINNLVTDIYKAVDEGFTIDEEHLSTFLEDVDYAVTRQLQPEHRQHGGTLRMSNLGKPDRQLWYEVNGCETKEELDAATRIKFLFGDLVEALVLLLVKSAGYKVTHEQAKVKVDGIVGHMDCEIEGVPVDVKSTSSYGFKKFADGTLADDDPFGYMAQISGYAHAREKDEGAFLAMDKAAGKLALMSVHDMDMVDIPERIKHLKEVTSSDTPPDRCYDAVPDGKSGNMKLAVGCSYCPYKDTCWSDANDGDGLRLFLYSNGPRWLTQVEREPDVFEKKGD